MHTYTDTPTTCQYIYVPTTNPLKTHWRKPLNVSIEFSAQLVHENISISWWYTPSSTFWSPNRNCGRMLPEDVVSAYHGYYLMAFRMRDSSAPTFWVIASACNLLASLNGFYLDVPMHVREKKRECTGKVNCGGASSLTLSARCRQCDFVCFHFECQWQWRSSGSTFFYFESSWWFSGG